MKTGNRLHTLVASFSVLFLSSCGSIWHQPKSDFGVLDGYNAFKADFEALLGRSKNRGRAVAVELVRRGATCIIGRNTVTDTGDAVFECGYFYCKGPSLQQIGWYIPEYPVGKIREQGDPIEFSTMRKQPDLSSISYEFIYFGRKVCSDKSMIREQQRQFMLRHGGSEFIP